MTNAGEKEETLARGRIRRIALERGEAGLTIAVDVTNAKGGATSLVFRNARDVHFRGATTELTEHVLLLARDISSRGWERCSYEVQDDEENVISFCCEIIESSAIVPP